ncbi:hypothetical protein [Pontiella desulfatans]|uniref:hypothetical protein n=1 Tax=Pontiella desulfatans TaxID=2750659 RepID=UPI00109CA087|nr:hypothetical protein [Pontiella desulfatans]
MQKPTRRLMTALLLGASLALIGCGGDDDGGDNGSEANSSIVGTWTGHVNSTHAATLVLNSDNTAQWSTDDSNGIIGGNYSINGNQLIVALIVDGTTINLDLLVSGSSISGTGYNTKGEASSISLAKQ